VVEQDVIVCCGSGGVGKTTTAAVIALEGAKQGRKAVVVTIDPAKRLADTLGIGSLSNTATRIEGEWPGELWALMLDTKSTFDDLVATYAPDKAQAERILENRFYRNISSALSGTQEYMAGEKLYELHELGADTPEGVRTRFDLVVVDTPPTRNALDFLDASRRLTTFLDHRIYRMLMVPTRAYLKAVNVAAQAFVRTVSRIVGGEVLDDALAFFTAFEGMEEGFRDRAAHVRAPTSPRSSRAATSPSPASWSTACTPASARPHPAQSGRGPPRSQGRGSAPSTATSPTSGRSPRARSATCPAWPAASRRRRSCGCRSWPRTCTTCRRWSRSPPTCSTAEDGRRSGGGLGVGERLDSRLLALRHRRHPVEPGGVQEPGDRRPGAVDGDVAADLPGPAHAADQGAEAGGVEERDAGEVDQEPGRTPDLGEGLAELGDREGVELTHRSAHGVVTADVDVDLEHWTSNEGVNSAPPYPCPSADHAGAAIGRGPAGG
jgi:anion-transporting  ArsA/GET3 family ATPase